MTYEELREEFSRPSFRKRMKDRLGEKCVNCSSYKSIEYHHIVPLKNGGTNNLGNIVPLCEECHCKAHNRIYKNAKNNGRPKVIEFEDAEPILQKYFNLEIGKAETCKLLGVNPKSNSIWDRIVREYKKKHKVKKNFRNNIDIKNFHTERVRKYMENKNS